MVIDPICVSSYEVGSYFEIERTFLMMSAIDSKDIKHIKYILEV